MARPRKVKFGAGEITLSGYSPEEADKIEEWITTVFSGVPSTARGNPEVLDTGLPKVGDIVVLREEKIEVVDTTTLTHEALDLYLDPTDKEYHVVHVKYNPVSKSAKVTEFQKAGSFRLAGVNTLKMELVRLGKV